ncbi:MAG: BtrH N-terminal domain-containing protein, partial [Acidimicrobiia bacterium]|nr:BtrH N-terminal domain-containing protein [Acidimicrobiia bacterium]
GVVGPDGTPMSEALAFGLAGGVGFLYGVFQYGDTPTMTIVARNQSMPDPFCEQLFRRLGLAVDISTTTGSKKAATDLDHALADGRPVLCTVGAGALPYLGLREGEAAMSPHLVGVVGVDGERSLLIDDRSPTPIPVDRADLDRARAAYRQGKHRLVAVRVPGAGAGTGVGADAGSDVRADPDARFGLDWPVVLEAAVAEAVAGFNRPPVPRFASNVGLSGLGKWQELLTSPTGKGWGAVFGEGQRAAIGLARLHDCINNAYTTPDAGRPLFARFLEEGAEAARRPDWMEAARLWSESGRAWREMSDVVLSAHPDLEHYGRLSDQRSDALDSGEPDPAAMAALTDEQHRLVEEFQFDREQAGAVHRRLSEIVATIVELESQGLDLLR